MVYPKRASKQIPNEVIAQACNNQMPNSKIYFVSNETGLVCSQQKKILEKNREKEKTVCILEINHKSCMQIDLNRFLNKNQSTISILFMLMMQTKNTKKRKKSTF